MGERPKSNLGILYVDVIVSSPAHTLAGDVAAFPEVRACLSLCQDLVSKRGGSVVKTAFDGAMFSFADADAALLAGREMQALVQQHPTRQARDVSVRIGLHFGSPITAGVAAQRVALLAGSGQIFTTGETLEMLSPQQREMIRKLELPSRAKSHSITVYEVIWHTSHRSAPPAGGPRSIAHANGVMHLRLSYLGHETVVDTKITIGRRPGHGIELNDPSASRDHAYIERRTDKFVLVDHSSHGTFISAKGEGEHRLHHAEVVLHDSGVLSFGSPARHQAPEVVKFRCDPPNAIGETPKRH